MEITGIMTAVQYTDGMLKVSGTEFAKETMRGTRGVGDGVAEDLCAVEITGIVTAVQYTKGILKVSGKEFGKERGRGTRGVDDGVAEDSLRSGNNRNHERSTIY